MRTTGVRPTGSRMLSWIMALFPSIEHGAKQFGGTFAIVHRRMRLSIVPGQPGGLHRTAENGLSVGEPGQRYRIECAEGMERIAFMGHARHRRVDEAQIETCVVTDQDRALAAGITSSHTHMPKNDIERFAFGL